MDPLINDNETAQWAWPAGLSKAISTANAHDASSVARMECSAIRGYPALQSAGPVFMRATRQEMLAHPGPAAALAFDHSVALLEQSLALAVLALLLLLDVGAFRIGHDRLQTSTPGTADLIRRLSITRRQRSGL